MGHGVVVRVVWGPVEVRGAADRLEVRIRRYLCLLCATVIRVGPRGLAPRRRYGLGAIALGLLLYALADVALPVGVRHAAARDAVSPDQIVAFESEHRWRSLERWTGAVQTGLLFEDVLLPVGLSKLSGHAVLRRLGQALVVHASMELAPAMEAWTAFRAAHEEGWVM